jgi:hypothetical protein
VEWDGARFKYNKRKIEDDGREYDMWDYYNMNIKNNKNKIYHHDKKNFAGRYTTDQILNAETTNNEYKTVAQKALNIATNNNPDLATYITTGYGRKKTKKKGSKKKGSKKKGSKKKGSKKKRKTRKK